MMIPAGTYVLCPYLQSQNDLSYDKLYVLNNRHAIE